MIPDRRKFLRLAGLAGGGLLLGVAPTRTWLPDEEVLRQAFALMKKKQFWGVLIAVPEEEKQRLELGTQLERLINQIRPPTFTGTPFWSDEERLDLALLLQEAVFVCVDRKLTGAKGETNAVLLNERGERVQEASLSFDRPKEFVVQLRSLLCDEGRSQQRASLIKAPGLKEAIAGLQKLCKAPDEELGRGAPSWVRVRELLPMAAPALAHEIRELPESPEATRVRVYLSFAVADELTQVSDGTARIDRMAHKAGKPPAPVLHGVKWDLDQVYDPCPPCGLTVVTRTERKFLRFLSRKP